MRLRRGGGAGREGLRGAPVVKHADLLHAGDGAAHGAGLYGVEFTDNIFAGVFGERRAGVAALLRAPVHQAILTDIEIAGAGAATPLVILAAGDVVLEVVEARVGTLAQRHDLLKDALLVRAERLQLAIAVVQHADSAGEAERKRAARDGKRVFGIFYAAAEDGVDIDLKLGVLGEQDQLLVEQLRLFFETSSGIALSMLI